MSMDEQKILSAEGGVQEYLTFTLGKEEYAMDILKVQEIRGYDSVTHIANSPDFMKGVINLRGVIVPIIDMRIKFDLDDVVYDEFTVVIIMKILGRVIGMVVDGVSDVVTLLAEQIKPAPEFGSSINAEYITGIGTVNEQMLILTDIERLIGSDDMQLSDHAENVQNDHIRLAA
ncbi:MAG: chemotaxis protein CheW [Geobacteraceae bacterium GWC2_53_11]|nr:MAG: chemotaxis protein CheW [Geobacteraceae bacterium GWC2_53_11]